MTKKEPKTVTRRERVVYITNKIQKIKASIHSFIHSYQVPGTGTSTTWYQVTVYRGASQKYVSVKTLTYLILITII